MFLFSIDSCHWENILRNHIVIFSPFKFSGMGTSNGVIMQYFQWYFPSDGTLWKQLTNNAKELAEKGITAIWLPPCSKSAGGKYDVGYGVYDLFDLGEFDQKQSVRTKYGTKEELIDAVKTAQQNGLQIYADVVFNHKDGGDGPPEEFLAQEVDWHNRNSTLSDWHTISAYTNFNFAARDNKYSSMKWYWWCFDSLSYNAITGNTNKLYRIKHKNFSTEVSHEHGNYDYLMANDLDTSEPMVEGELRYWGRWIVDTLGIDGFRVDAVKHIRASFFRDWLNHLRTHFSGKELFSVGEYWSADIDELHTYIDKTESVMSLFDVPLHYKFYEAGLSGASFDMRTLVTGTLAATHPAKAVTFVDNHDTQPCQSLQSWVEPWFKPLAYAFVLLRKEGYPCIFYGDYKQSQYSNCRGGSDVVLWSHRFLIDIFLQARKWYGYGDQHDYFDHPSTVGWLRLGTQEHPGAMAVIMTNGNSGYKWMNVFRPHATFYDATRHIQYKITANENGYARFECSGGSVSVWLQE